MSMNGGNMFAPRPGKPEVLFSVKAQRGGFDQPETLRCKGWKQETILRMLENNMENAEIPELLVIYGGNQDRRLDYPVKLLGFNFDFEKGGAAGTLTVNPPEFGRGGDAGELSGGGGAVAMD